MAMKETNGNGRTRELVLWILGLAVPVLIAALAALYVGQSAHGERIKGCEVQQAAAGEDLKELKADVKEILRRLPK